MSVIQTIHLSVLEDSIPQTIPAVQNDTDRSVKMIIDDLTLTSGMTGTLNFKRSDGSHYGYTATLDTSDNSFTAPLDQALTQPGRTYCQLKVTDTDVVSTFTFIINVTKDVSGTVTEQEGINLVSAVQAAEDAADRAEAAASTFETDTSLSVAGMAADAKATGNAISAIEADLIEIDATLTQEGKAADAKATGDEIGELRNNTYNLNSQMLASVGKIVGSNSTSVRLTLKKLATFGIVAGHKYTLKFVLDSAKEFVTYCYLKDSNGTNVIATTIPAGTTEKTEAYTASTDKPESYALFQTQYDGDATVTVFITDSIYDLQNKVDIKYGINMFDPSTTLVTGLLTNNGAVATGGAYDNYRTTDYVAVKATDQFSNSTEAGTYRKVCFYDSTKTILSSGAYVENVNTFTVPSGASYIRISISASFADYLALMKSSSPVPFSQYSVIGGYLEGYTGFEKYDHIPYGASLFTSTLNAQGTSRDNAHATCYKRHRNENVRGVIFACRAYASHTYFCAFDSSGDIIDNYTLSGATTTSHEHTVEFGNDVVYYSVFTLSTDKSASYISEIIDDCGVALVEAEKVLNLRNDKTYREIKTDKLEKWSEMQFGMFIHWGVYSAWAGEYEGLNIDGEEITVHNGTEWMWQANKIPKATYMAKESDFTGENWNPDYVCRLAKMLGMKHIVITARHHEGFSLMESDHCEWDISDSSCTRDVLMELKEACNRYHLKFCLYVSPLMDWCDEGGFGQEAWHSGSDPYTFAQHSAFTDDQLLYLNELVEKYDPFVIWYDGGTYVSVPNELKVNFNNNQMKNYPYAIVNNRGEGIYDYKLAENTYADYPGTPDKYERCNTFVGWGYNLLFDNISNYPSASSALWDMMENMGRGFNYLLNIAPKGDGSIPDPYMTRFTEMSTFFQRYTYFNNAKRLFNYCQPSWGRPLNVGNSIYLFLLPNGSNTITLDSIITDNIKGVHVYGIENPDSDSNYTIVSDDVLEITNIPTTSDDYFPVVRVDYNGDPICMDYNVVDDSISGMSLVRTEYNEWASTTTGVRVNGYYRFGSDDSKSVSRFLYDGTTGSYEVKLNGTLSGSATFTINVYDDTGDKIFTSSVTNYVTDFSVSLTNGEIYMIEIVKTGSGTMQLNSLTFE